MRNQKCNAMQLIGRQSLGVVVIAFSPPTASILWVSNKNNALWLVPKQEGTRNSLIHGLPVRLRSLRKWQLSGCQRLKKNIPQLPLQLNILGPDQKNRRL